MKTGKIITTILISLFINFSVLSQTNRSKTKNETEKKGWEYQIKTGFNIGGIAPISLPRQIRSIDGYNPKLLLSMEANITKWLGISRKWGITSGIKIENKGMTTKSTVKSYNMVIIGDDGNRLEGNWTGGVKTKVQNSYLSVPILAAYRINSRFTLKGGTYISYLTDGNFSGNVYEGYLRKDNPSGEKIIFDNGAMATYDFSDDLSKVQFGIQAGLEWKAYKHLVVNSELTWGINNAFKSSFKTINFNMYPIYLNLGFGYTF